MIYYIEGVHIITYILKNSERHLNLQQYIFPLRLSRFPQTNISPTPAILNIDSTLNEHVHMYLQVSVRLTTGYLCGI